MYKSFFLCRNILEIPSILLPHIGILKPSYAERVNFFGKSLNILYKITPFTDWNKINESIKYSMKIKMNPSILKETIERLIFDDDKLTAIKANCKKFYFKNAANEIAKSAIELINLASSGQSEI